MKRQGSQTHLHSYGLDEMKETPRWPLQRKTNWYSDGKTGDSKTGHELKIN